MFDPELYKRAEAARGDITFEQRICDLLKERGISKCQMSRDTGMARRMFYPEKDRRMKNPSKATLMACAYYFGITGEELVEGTLVADTWYRVWDA